MNLVLPMSVDIDRNLLIVYPHWPPSNLVGGYRARLIANQAKNLGWKVTVLTVHERHYEDPSDQDLELLVDESIDVIKVGSYPVLSIFGYRLLGDIGIRAYFHLRKAMLDILANHEHSFVWIPIPSWYTSMLGNVALRNRGIPFGIDYIDPWVYKLSKEEGLLTKGWLTRQLALILEPMAIKRASLVSGVSREYYLPALMRTFGAIENHPLDVAMPYGFDPNDHATEPSSYQPPWTGTDPYLLYAGAFLPQSEYFMTVAFEVVRRLEDRSIWPAKLKLRFVGTGVRAGRSIRELATAAGINHLVEEYPERIPFLQVQKALRESFATMVIGSTEKHYTASKTFQCILSKKPVFSVLHAESTAASFLNESAADNFLVRWDESLNDQEFVSQMTSAFVQLIDSAIDDWNPNLQSLERHSAKQSARQLFQKIEEIILK